MEYIDFLKEIYKMTNIDLNMYKEKQMKRRINSLITKNQYEGYKDYLEGLKINSTLFSEFIDYITINVSEFYRNPEQWNILEQEILPNILKKTASPKIWSAACSTGEEPYTLVMVLNRYLPLNKINILATDLDKKALEAAKIGSYVTRNMEKVPKENISKYFTEEGTSFKIKDELKRAVTFKAHNLLSDPYPKDCDLIICRNVLIYFTEEAKDLVYREMSKALKKGGILFVGSTEQIITPVKYNLSSIRTFFYVKQ